MAREVVIAAVQLPDLRQDEPGAAQQESNWQTAARWLDEAGQRGADIACVGETFNALGLRLQPETLHATVAEAVARASEQLGAVARRHRMHIIAPVYGLWDGTPRNVALLLDRDGVLVGSYCKVHCTEAERDLGIIPGDAWPVFDLDFGCIGIQICHDNSFPESARCLMLNGAEVIFWPHVQSGWGDVMWDITLRSRAIDNGVHHVAVSYGCPPHRAWKPGMMVGRSSIVAPDGTITADAGRYPGIALARVDLDAPRLAHSFTRAGEYVFRADMLDDRRPDTYQPLTRPWTRRGPVAPPSPTSQEVA